MVVATFYALGHAVIVFALGTAAVVFSARLPASVGTVMERVVGVTLLLLGIYVVVSLVRHGRALRMRSRWMLVIALCRRVATSGRRREERPAAVVVIEHDHPHRHGDAHVHVATGAAPGAPRHDHEHREALQGTGAGRPTTVAHRHRHRHVVTMPADPFVGTGALGAVGVGVLHGIGAETPTQVAVFVGAAGVAGAVAGLVVLAAFVVGLLVSNTAIALASTFGVLGSAGRRGVIFLGVSVLTATFSLVVGALFVAGRADALPAFLGG
jgi:high-affinity nickel-transport protein